MGLVGYSYSIFSYFHVMTSYLSILMSSRKIYVAHCANSPDIMTQRFRAEVLP